jgi:hypothetical protein
MGECRRCCWGPAKARNDPRDAAAGLCDRLRGTVRGASIANTTLAILNLLASLRPWPIKAILLGTTVKSADCSV